jgi:hypothetical protein
MVQQLPNQWDIQGQTLGALGLHLIVCPCVPSVCWSAEIRESHKLYQCEFDGFRCHKGLLATVWGGA